MPSLVFQFDEEERASSFSLCRLVNVLAASAKGWAAVCDYGIFWVYLYFECHLIETSI